MFRYAFFMFLLAVVVLGLMIAHPGPAAGQEAQDAMRALYYNTDWLTQARKNKLLSQVHAMGPILAHEANENLPAVQDDEGAESFLDIHARGPMLAEPVFHESQEGPMLAEAPLYGPRVDPPVEQEGPSATIPEVPEQDDDDAEIYQEIPADQEALYREIRRLRKDVDRLRQEADARESLRITEAEERDQESEILDAAGREYSLMRTGMLGMDLRAVYTYNSYDVIRDLYRQEGTQLEYHTDHTIMNDLSFEFPRRDNLTLQATIPFVYKYDRVATEQSRDVNDLGDISLGAKYQPFKSGTTFPSPIVSFGYTFPTGRGAYDIDPNRELSTGSGLHSISTGLSISQPFDPVNAFASLSYNHSFSREKIKQRLARGTLMKVSPGEAIGASIGFGYALSYRMSMSLGLSYSYQFSTSYHWNDGTETKSGDRIASSLSLNTSWRVTPSRRVIVGVSKGLTRDSSDFSLSMRLPIEFDLR